MFAVLIFLAIIAGNVVVGVYLERKVSAFIQDRMGPMEVGKWGLLQLVADLIKLLQKEDIVAKAVDKGFFKFAPVLVFLSVFLGFSVIPLNASFIGSNMEAGIYFLMAIVSIDILGIMMAGWSSNNKYSLLGAMRSVAQIISYEIPVGLSILSVVMIAQTLNLQEISYQQGIFSTETNYLFGIKALGIDITKIGGFFSWNIFRSPFLLIVFVIFYIATLAESNRAPFDLPEAESELVGGFHTEYSGFRWAIFMLSEYGMMLLMSLLGAILFLGSWNTPLPNIGTLKLADITSGTSPDTISSYFWGAFWLLSKAYFLVFTQMWVRWTLPRLRIDQLMYLSWKVLTPFAIALLFISGIWRMLMIM